MGLTWGFWGGGDFELPDHYNAPPPPIHSVATTRPTVLPGPHEGRGTNHEIDKGAIPHIWQPLRDMTVEAREQGLRATAVSQQGYRTAGIAVRIAFILPWGASSLGSQAGALCWKHAIRISWYGTQSLGIL